MLVGTLCLMVLGVQLVMPEEQQVTQACQR